MTKFFVSARDNTPTFQLARPLEVASTNVIDGARHRTAPPFFIAVALACVALAACSGEGNNGPSGTSNPGAPLSNQDAAAPTDCPSLCKRTASECGVDANSCLQQCERLTSAQIVCMAAAQCNQAAQEACLGSSSAGGSAGTTSGTTSGAASGTSSGSSGAVCIALSQQCQPPDGNPSQCCSPGSCFSETTGARCCIKLGGACSSDDDCCGSRSSSYYGCVNSVCASKT